MVQIRRTYRSAATSIQLGNQWTKMVGVHWARLAIVSLFSGALVMSTVAIRQWIRDGAHHHHIVDPRSGRSADTDLLAVAVADNSAARGEALAKAALIAGESAGAALLGAADLKAWLISADHVHVVQE